MRASLGVDTHTHITSSQGGSPAEKKGGSLALIHAMGICRRVSQHSVLAKLGTEPEGGGARLSAGRLNFGCPCSMADPAQKISAAKLQFLP